jgi:hypothetical protein
VQVELLKTETHALSAAELLSAAEAELERGYACKPFPLPGWRGVGGRCLPSRLVRFLPVDWVRAQLLRLSLRQLDRQTAPSARTE